MSVDDDGVEHLHDIAGRSAPTLEALGWSPDGRYVAIQGTRRWGEYTTVLLDTMTAKETLLDATFGHLSNDGSMVAGFSTVGEGRQVCIQRIDGDRCIHLGEHFAGPGLTKRPPGSCGRRTTAGSRPTKRRSHLVWLLSSDETEPDVSISGGRARLLATPRAQRGFPWP